MNWLRLTRIIQKELRQLKRDPRLVQVLLAAPLIQLLFFGYAISTDLKGVRLGVVQQDPSPEARALVRAVEGTGVFDLTRTSSSPDDVQNWLDSGAAQIVLHIPPGFASALSRGEAPVVQVLSDGSDPNTATLAFQYLSGASTSWAFHARREQFQRHPQEAARFVGVPQVDLETRFWYNPELKSVNFQIPGVLAMLSLVLTLTPTSMMIVKERELGTLEQLAVTPVSPTELLVGKTVPIAVTSLVMVLLTTIIAQFWFHVPLRGSIFFLMACATLFQLNTLGLGLLLSTVSRTQLQAQLLASFVTTPMVMLSGFLFPIANMPVWVQWATYLLPMRYYMDVVRGVFLKGQGLSELWPQALAITLLGAALYLGGIFSFRKRAD